MGLWPMIRIAVFPLPTPRNVRPGARTLIVAMLAAVTGAGLVAATATPGPNRIVEVRSAARARTA